MTDTQTPATFCIWLQGFLDGAGDSLDTNQLATLTAKLNAVFTHPEPGPDPTILTERPDPFTEKVIEDIKKQKAIDDFIRDEKWIYKGPPIPQTWPSPRYQPGRLWPPLWPPQINC